MDEQASAPRDRPDWRRPRTLLAEGARHLLGMAVVVLVLAVVLLLGHPGGVRDLPGAAVLAPVVAGLLGLLAFLVVLGHLLPTYLLRRPAWGVTGVTTTLAWLGAWLLVQRGWGKVPTDHLFWFSTALALVPFLALTALARALVPALRPAGHRPGDRPGDQRPAVGRGADRPPPTASG